MRGLTQSHDVLVGRGAERSRLAETIAGARAGRGGAVVVAGEAGIGKSALLEDALVQAASGCTVLRASGAEFEQELPYAALHQLCLPVLPDLDDHEALRVAFGLSAGTADPFRVGVAVLDLIGAAARERPVLCVVDDAQWFDAASLRVLAFLARRVAADPVAVLFGVRSPVPAGELATLPRLSVDGLDDGSAAELLAVRSPFPLDERVRDRLVAEAHGNPLALLELPRAGGFAPPEESPVATRIERAFRTRLARLPADARLLLTVASADPTGDPDLLWPAARTLGIDLERAGAAAATAELAEFGTRIRFCHPLARSAVHRAAAAWERRRAHAALADATDPVLAPDRRAWHRAQATFGPDEDVAAELVRAAWRARARGGVAAAAAFLERAAALSPQTGRRVQRTLDAAAAHLDAGAGETAARLLTTIETAGLDEVRRAHVELLRGRIAFTRPGDGSGPALMASAAARLAGPDPRRARECYLDAMEMSLVVGRGGGFIREVVIAAGAAPASGEPDLLDALLTLATDGPASATPLLRGVLHGERAPLWTRWPALATMISTELWDPATMAEVAEWLVTAGRTTGSPLLLRLGLAQRATGATFAGDVERALAAIAEEGAIADAVGEPPLVYPRLQLAAVRGRRAEAHELTRAASAATTARGTGQVVSLHWTTALLNNGLRDYPAALAAAVRATEQEDLFLTGAALPELVEAAVRCHEPARAARALESLTERTRGTTATGRGIAAYARGLVTGVEEHYREAVQHLTDSPLVPYRGRAHLLYGEWLRREGRRRDGVEQLRLAHGLLSASGAEGFARRAADELQAAGERVERLSEPAYDRLTPQELAVSRLVSSGATSHEVAVALFISKRTVDAHLRNIFRKLGVNSRRQLRDQPGIAS